jgi:hypothetical protein
MEAAAPFPSLLVLENVRCLGCSEVYSKPMGGGTVLKNPGCPSCGYLGWIPVSLPLEQRARRRSAEGRRLLPSHPTY